jgi:glutamate 5-kinase
MENNPLQALSSGARHTLFTARQSQKSARKRRIEGHVQTKGRVIIDQGAQKALEGGKSLLPVGVKTVEGAFIRGDAVTICSVDGEKLGIGLIAYDHDEAEKLIGQPSSAFADLLGYAGRDEIIHRDDMVLRAE